MTEIRRAGVTAYRSAAVPPPAQDTLPDGHISYRDAREAPDTTVQQARHERNQRIVDAVRNGASLTDVARGCGLTREMVRLIARKAGVRSVYSGKQERPCTVPDCSRAAAREGRGTAPLSPYCAMHRARWLSHGTVLRRVLPGDIHGTLARYRRGCHCAECTAANTAYVRDQRNKREARVRAGATVPHGTASGYKNYGCRCEPCRAAGLAARLATRARLTQRGKDHPELIPHGTASAVYLWQCRCPVCRAADWHRDTGRPVEEYRGRQTKYGPLLMEALRALGEGSPSGILAWLVERGKLPGGDKGADRRAIGNALRSHPAVGRLGYGRYRLIEPA